MRIYKRGDVWWCQFQGKRKSLGVTDRKAAEIAFRELQRRAADPSTPKACELGQAIRRMLASKAASRSAGTLDFYKTKVGHLRRVIGPETPVSDITAGTVDTYIATRRAERVSDYTIDKELIALSQLLKQCKRAGEWQGDLDTLRPVGFSAGYKPREAVLTAEAETLLRQALTPEQWGTVAFLLGTGARRAEMLAAQAGDIDLEQRTVRLRGTKTAAAARVIPVLELTRPYLEAAVLPCAWRVVGQRLPKVCKRLGLPPLSPNDLRRTLGTRLMASGADPYDVAKVLGHASIAMLRRVYERMRVDELRQRLERDPQ